jgi:hypothetical protein
VGAVIARCLDRKTAPTPTEEALIAAFPSVCFSFGKMMAEQPALLAVLEQNPFCALYAIYGCRSLARILEARVMVSGEALAEYETWRKDQGVQSVVPSDVLLKALAAEPFWALRHFDRTNDKRVVEEMQEFARLNHRDHAGAAWAWLILNDNLTANQYNSVLHGSPLYAYLASQFLEPRGFQLDLAKLGQLSPRWAFHFVMARPENCGNLIEESLISCPAWLVEYVIQSGFYKNHKDTWSLIEHCDKRTLGLSSPGGPGAEPRSTSPGMLVHRTLLSDWFRSYAWYCTWNKIRENVEQGIRRPAPADPDQIYGDAPLS